MTSLMDSGWADAYLDLSSTMCAPETSQVVPSLNRQFSLRSAGRARASELCGEPGHRQSSVFLRMPILVMPAGIMGTLARKYLRSQLPSPASRLHKLLPSSFSASLPSRPNNRALRPRPHRRASGRVRRQIAQSGRNRPPEGKLSSLLASWASFCVRSKRQ